MLFNSYEFIFLFLPVAFFVYFWLLHKRLVLGSKIWLVGGSLFFYGYWNIVYIPLLLGSILVNFFIGTAMADTQNTDEVKNSNKRLKTFSSIQLLFFGIIFNIALLAYFKYTDFFLTNFNSFFEANIPLIHIILPLGISFFTFTQIAFLVDAYKQKVKEYDLVHYMLFVTFFPHLLAGPILHHKEMMPQFGNKWNLAIRWRNIAGGLFLFSIGLFKKVVIADTFAQCANSGFDIATTLNLVEAWATSLSYTLQLYFDFSGYTDMAIGVSLLFNIKLPANFNSPYKAISIQDFWRRWHITLSRFLRDYIYIPLGGNKVSRFRNYFNLFSVFLIGGLWHGASWMFVIWGALHGVAIVLHRIWSDLKFTMNKYLAWFITVNFINVTWVFFRAKDFDTVKKILGGMVGTGGIVFPDKLAVKLAVLNKYGIVFENNWLENAGLNGTKDLFFMALMMLFTVWFRNSNEWADTQKPTLIHAFFTAALLLFGILSLSKVSEFIYFQF